MKVKEESEEVGLKLNIQKTKVMASGPITSYHGGEGRTRMNVRHVRFADFIPLAVIVLFGAGLILLNLLGIGYTMK